MKKKTRKAPTVAKLKKQAWKLLSELVRRSAADQDGGCNCYTCGAWHKWNSGLRGMHAGHALGGRAGAVLLDQELIRPQCAMCNCKPPYGRGGETHIFNAKLIRERASLVASEGFPTVSAALALDWWEAKLSASRQVRKWNRSELEAKIEDYKARLSRL